MKLILGTAEFGQTAYGEGVTAPPSLQEIVRILNLAYEAGINTLDTSDQYDSLPIIEQYGGGYGRLHKTRTPGVGFYHYKQDEKAIPLLAKRASIYTKEQLVECDQAIIPLNINYTEFAGVKLPRLYIRSVFDRGRLLKQGYTVKDCLSFVKRHHAQGVIVGVNSVKELEEVLKAWGI